MKNITEFWDGVLGEAEDNTLYYGLLDLASVVVSLDDIESSDLIELAQYRHLCYAQDDTTFYFFTDSFQQLKSKIKLIKHKIGAS